MLTEFIFLINTFAFMHTFLFNIYVVLCYIVYIYLFFFCWTTNILLFKQFIKCIGLLKSYERLYIHLIFAQFISIFLFLYITDFGWNLQQTNKTGRSYKKQKKSFFVQHRCSYNFEFDFILLENSFDMNSKYVWDFKIIFWTFIDEYYATDQQHCFNYQCVAWVHDTHYVLLLQVHLLYSMPIIIYNIYGVYM